MSIEGPRPLRAGEFPSLGRLLNAVFRSTRPGDMLKEYAQLLNPGNLENIMVIAEGGEIVSHTAMLVRDHCFEGTTLKIGLIGAVGTSPACRGKGYATAILDALLDKAARAGVDLAWISGNRSLYTNRGAAFVGRTFNYTIPAGPETSGIELREWTADDLLTGAALHRREPSRFIREWGDWTYVFASRMVMNWPTRFWGVWRGERMTAYLLVHEPHTAGQPSSMAEFAGDRQDAAAALPGILARMGLPGTIVHVMNGDAAGRAAFARLATDTKTEKTRGLCLPLRMVAVMERLRPRVAECCGAEIASQFQPRETGVGPATPEGRDDRLQITLGQEVAEIRGRDDFARLLFDAPDSAAPSISGSRSVIEALRPALPLPPPWYGLSYA